ncbi:hypothetical protein QUF64_00680 [Anaerolineales bacterium HSG6]|nr:hypothetical protein [Anaerolineales bacterium HSG6]MDM8532302.1 hypothetical protein [Anaerolineales bacterium HSG25]
MSPDLREYKTQTLNQLLILLPQIEAKLAHEIDSAAIRRLNKQLEAIRAHIDHLRHELSLDAPLDPVAEVLFQKAAEAIVKEKYFLAQKRLQELETIEPFYPGLNRLKDEISSGKTSRNTKAIAEGTVPAFVLASIKPAYQGVASDDSPLSTPAADVYLDPDSGEEQTGGWRNIFQFHIMASCLVVVLMFCTMAGVGGTALLEFLIEGS